MPKIFDKDITKGVIGNAVFWLLSYGVAGLLSLYTAHSAALGGLPAYKTIPLGVGVFLGIALGTNLLSLIIVRHNRNRKVDQGKGDKTSAVKAESQVPSNNVTVIEECHEKWLHEIADNDNRFLDKYIKVEACEIVGHELLHTAPHVDFKFTVLNASVYTISLEDSVKGDIYLDSQLLSKEVKMIENPARHCAHGESKHFILRQWLSREEVAGILNASDGADDFRLSRLEMMIRNISLESENNPKKLDLYGLRLSSKPLRELYRKLDIKITQAKFKGGGYFGGLDDRFLVVSIEVSITNPRSKRVAIQGFRLLGKIDGKDYSKDYVVYAQTGEIYLGRVIDEEGGVQIKGRPLTNLNPSQDSPLIIEPLQSVDGWLQFIIKDGIGFEEPSQLPTELIVIDVTGEEHRAQCLLNYGE